MTAMKPTTSRILALLLFVAAGAACGSAPQQHTKLPPEPVIALPADAPKPGEWSSWSHEQKLAYMKGGFMTAQRAIWASWEPARFRDLECRNCHGRGVADGTFQLPNPDLPHLYPGKEGFMELAQHEPEVLAFMQQRLVPETARLLGVPPFDMEAHTGFSCYQCHTRQNGK